MLTAHRRHLPDCPHLSKGWNYTLCDCPVWCDGRIGAGPRLRKSLNTTDWARALRRMAAWERGEDAPESSRGSGRTIAQAAAAFLESRRQQNLKASSIASYARTFRHVEAMIGKEPVADVQVATIEAYLDSRQIAPRTRRKELEYLRAFFAWCLDRGWIAGNPARRIRPPRIDDIATLPFTPEEIIQMLEAAERMVGMWTEDTPLVRRRARALVLTLLYSGLRVGDVAQLRRAALERSGHLVLRIMKTGVPLKVLLHPDAVAALEALPAPGGNPTYFFWSGNGDIDDCSKSLWRTVARIGKLAGVHAHPHRFRDTFAVELLTRGVDIRTVQQLLGHESIKTTEKHYAHFVAAHQLILDSAVSSLDFRPKSGRPVAVSPLKNRRRNS